MSTAPAPEERLAAALRLARTFREAGRQDAAEFLAEHEALRELLAPMIVRDPATPLASTGSTAVTSELPMREHFVRGSEIGGYRIEGLLGQGGMGSVYLATQVSLGREVALKTLSSPTLLAGERAFWRFQREARLLADLDHPGIVQVIESGVHAGVPYFVMERVRGASLSVLLTEARSRGLARTHAGLLDVRSRRGGSAAAEAVPSPRARRDYIRRVAELVAQVADALECAHAAGVVHRDVKPSNILIHEDGHALLADFGVARREGTAALTLTGEFAGTPTHMSPEQARGEEVDRRTDVFALGVVLYEALTLRLPFPGDHPAQVLDRLLHHEPTEPRSIHPGIPRELAALVLGALEKDPARRYGSARELGADLRAFLDGEPLAVRPPNAVVRAWRWSQRERWKAFSAALTSIAVAVLGALYIGYTNRLAEESNRTKAALVQVNRLAIGIRLERALASAANLRGEGYRDVVAVDRWIVDEGEPLAAEVPELQRLLRELRTRARPCTPEEAEFDRRAHPMFAGIARIDREVELVSAAARGGDAELVAEARRKVDFLQQARSEILAKLALRVRWTFAEAEAQFLHDQVAALVQRLEAFCAPGSGTLSRVKDLRRAAESNHRRCIVEAEARWREVAKDVAADPRFGGLVVTPQRDLLPLRQDGRSGLWEFVHLPSGAEGKEVPGRLPDGSARVGAQTGIVFVLLPGGVFTMGAQATDPQAPNYDPDAAPLEGPPHRVEVGPFLLSKYETTQAQWRRLSGLENPSMHGTPVSLGGSASPLHPVESITQENVVEVLTEFGLALPTEAQWEYACRAGKPTGYWFGDPAKASRFANVADRSRRGTHVGSELDLGLDDTFSLHAPVGSFLPNPFGLHDMQGNVAEWTSDYLSPYELLVEGESARRQRIFTSTEIVLRGGSYERRLVIARASDRSLSGSPGYRHPALGFRAARRLESR